MANDKPPRMQQTDDARTQAAMIAYQRSMADGQTWRLAVREALAAADGSSGAASVRGRQPAGLAQLHLSTMGFAHIDPVTGWEWSCNHPVRSRECVDATAIKWMSLARFLHEHPQGRETPRQEHGRQERGGKPGWQGTVTMAAEAP